MQKTVLQSQENLITDIGLQVSVLCSGDIIMAASAPSVCLLCIYLRLFSESIAVCVLLLGSLVHGGRHEPRGGRRDVATT